MSKSISKNKNSYYNYLTLNNNCKIVPPSSAKPLAHLNPQNILTDRIREVWISNQLPASCVIDMKNMIQRPVYFNRIGFNCWHQYESNPRLIEIHFSSQDSLQNINWTLLSKIRLQLASDWQHFKIPITAAKNISYLKISILQNYAQSLNQNLQNQERSPQTKMYLNTVAMGFVQQIVDSRIEHISANQNVGSREKTFSDYRKLTTSERQIKKLGQKVKQLSNENQIMKRTIDHQSSIIFKLQQAMHSLAQNIGKLQKIQNLQEAKIANIEKHKQNKHYQLRNPNKIQEFFNDQSEIGKSIQSKNNTKQKNGSRHNSIYQENQNRSSKPNSNFKSGKGKSHKKQKQSNAKKRDTINPNIQQSQNSLSEYEGVVDQRIYRHNIKATGQKILQQQRKSQKQKQKTYIPMLQKLQQLIMLRDEKKNKLKSHKKSRMDQHMETNSQEDNENQQY